MERKNGNAVNLETKLFVPFTEIKANSDGTIEGYASRFGQVDQGGDMVAQGAYAASLAKGIRVKMLWQHDPCQPIGVWDDVHEDTTGLWVKGRILSAVERGAEAIALLNAGAIDGMSIGYRTIDAAQATVDGQVVRELKQLDLWEVSIVTFPMQTTATIRSRKAEDWQDPRFVETYLRDGGCSNAVAKAIASKGVKASQREVGPDPKAQLSAMETAIRNAFAN